MLRGLMPMYGDGDVITCCVDFIQSRRGRLCSVKWLKNGCNVGSNAFLTDDAVRPAVSLRGTIAPLSVQVPTPLHIKLAVLMGLDSRLGQDSSLFQLTESEVSEPLVLREVWGFVFG